MRLRFLTRNLGWKLLALSLAVLLWLAVSSNPEVVSFVSVPVQYKRIRGGLEISSDVIENVYLEVQGTPTQLARLNDSQPAVTFDFSQVSMPGERTFDIDERAISLPQGTRLVRAIPSQLRFDFDRRATKSVAVVARFIGELPAGCTLSRYETIPPTLTVVGPINRLARIDTAQADPIDLTGVKSKTEFGVNVFVDDPHVRFAGSPKVLVRLYVEGH